jgi:NgoMIV restriction enzyme
VPPPPFVAGLFGWRGEFPTCADKDSVASVAIATGVMQRLGVAQGEAGPHDPGSALEHGVADWLAEQLPVLDPSREWVVNTGRAVSSFEQYAHLERMRELLDENPTLRAELGGPEDYLIKPDVTVGITTGTGDVLHACVSSKWTIRSDRVQNVRHEAVMLIRHRRGRQPHIVGVTAEPLPTRLASIARGTGEVDAVYHVALDELVEATEQVGTPAQRQALTELVAQNRLLNLTALPGVLVV